MTKEFTTEVKREIWHDNDGYHYTVGPDANALGLVSVIDSDGKLALEVLPEAARQVAQAMLKCADEIESREKEEGK